MAQVFVRVRKSLRVPLLLLHSTTRSSLELRRFDRDSQPSLIQPDPSSTGTVLLEHYRVYHRPALKGHG